MADVFGARFGFVFVYVARALSIRYTLAAEKDLFSTNMRAKVSPYLFFTI